jgi:hypothetical protein
MSEVLSGHDIIFLRFFFWDDLLLALIELFSSIPICPLMVDVQKPMMTDDHRY